MAAADPTCPMTHAQLVEAYFLEHRAKLLDIAAFLDRLDRARGGGGSDFRMVAFARAIDVLRDDRPHRARRILELLSDHSADPIDKAPMKGALGAVPLSAD
jgi:hypothetical protein